MMALIALLLLILWVVIGMLLGRLLHRLFKLDAQWRGLVVLLVVLAPFIQEVAGRLQFAYLCDKYAVVWLSPDWQKVKAAREDSPPFSYLNWTVIPIKIHRIIYVDSASGQKLMSSTSLSSPGGLFQRTLASSIGHGYSCRPDYGKISEVYRMLDIEELMKGTQQ